MEGTNAQRRQSQVLRLFSEERVVGGRNGTRALVPQRLSCHSMPFSSLLSSYPGNWPQVEGRVANHPNRFPTISQKGGKRKNLQVAQKDRIGRDIEKLKGVGTFGPWIKVTGLLAMFTQPSSPHPAGSRGSSPTRHTKIPRIHGPPRVLDPKHAK